MSRSTYNIAYSSTNISSVTGHNTITQASNTSAAQEPLAACCCFPRVNQTRKCGSRKDSISEVTVNKTLYSEESTNKRRVVRCKNTNEKEMLTFHLKQKPESKSYNGLIKDDKKLLFNNEKYSGYQLSSILACHSGINKPPSHKRSISPNSWISMAKTYDEKTTNCSPVLNLNTAEFVERIIDKNNTLRRLVRSIVEAREKEKQQDAWNDYINELKNKHGSSYCGQLYIPEQYYIEHNKIFNRGSIWSQSRPKDDYCDSSNTLDYIKTNTYPNEILCYPISSTACLARSKNKNHEQPRRQYINTNNTIHVEERNYRKRKRKQPNNNQLRNVSVQTSKSTRGTGTDDYSYLTRNSMKDVNEGYEPCICTANSVSDVFVNTGKFQDEKGTLTDLENMSLNGYFCNKDQQARNIKDNFSSIETMRKIEALEEDTFLGHFQKKDKERSISHFKAMKQNSANDLWTKQMESKGHNIFFHLPKDANDVRIRELSEDSCERKQHESGKKTLCKIVTDNMTKLKEQLEESKTNDNSLVIIEEKLNTILSTMNDLLSEIKLRMLNMNIEKFDTATSTVLTNKKEEHETFIARMLLEQEIEFPKTDNNLQEELYNMDFCKSVHNTQNMFQLSAPSSNDFNQFIYRATQINNKNAISTNCSNVLTCTKSNTEAELPTKLKNYSTLTYGVARITSEDKMKYPVEHLHTITEPQPVQVWDGRLVSANQDLHRSRPSLTAEKILKLNKKANHATPENKQEHKHQTTSNPENKEESPDPNRSDNKKNIESKAKGQESCHANAKMKNMQHSRYHHVPVSLGRETSYITDIMLKDVNYSNVMNDQTKITKRQNALVDRAVSSIYQNTVKIGDNSKKTEMFIAVDRAVSKIDDNIFSRNHQQNYISLEQAVSKKDDIIKEEINKSNQAKKDINVLLNREFANNYSVQITFVIPTKERATEVTDSLSQTRHSNSSSSQGKKYNSNLSRRTSLSIAAVNTEPMSFLGLLQLSTYTVRQLLTFINIDYSSYLPSVSRTLPTAPEAVQYLCHICGAAFRKPSELMTHIKGHNQYSTKDCCVCRHILQLRQRKPGLFSCRFCSQCFTRAYCCALHERTCDRRYGRRLDVSESCAILK